MSESRVRENRTHGSMRRREATTASRASTRRAAEEASRRPYKPPYVDFPAKLRFCQLPFIARIIGRRVMASDREGNAAPRT